MLIFARLLMLCIGLAALTDQNALANAAPAAPVEQSEPSAQTGREPIMDHVAARATSVPAGTLIEIRIDEAISSKTHKTGDWFAISLAQPIKLGDAELVPAGTAGRGQVVHADKSSWGGKPGELILGARFIEFEGRQITLRSMKLGAMGQSNEGIAFAAGMAISPLPFVINGKNADIAVGTLATAKLAAALAGKEPPVASPEPSDAAAASSVSGATSPTP